MAIGELKGYAVTYTMSYGRKAPLCLNYRRRLDIGIGSRLLVMRALLGSSVLGAVVLLAACGTVELTATLPPPTPKATAKAILSATRTPIPQAEKPAESIDINATGAELYIAQCQSCHGDRTGVGATAGAPLHDETGHTWHHPDAQLKDWILNGKFGLGQMPAFQDVLSESDVDAILAYLKSWWTEAQRQGQADISQRYQEALDRQRQDR